MIKRIAALALAGALLFAFGAAAQRNVANYFEQTAGTDNTLVVGGTATVASGGVVTVASGGAVNVASGGALKLAGTDVTAILATAPAAVAAGYKLARGETALDGTNPTPVTPGLATIVACAVSLKTTSAPGVGTSIVTYGTSTTTLNLYGWKVTGTGDATLIASTGTETIGWVCVGT